jgi:hypothetical protein
MKCIDNILAVPWFVLSCSLNYLLLELAIDPS